MDLSNIRMYPSFTKCLHKFISANDRFTIQIRVENHEPRIEQQSDKITNFRYAVNILKTREILSTLTGLQDSNLSRSRCPGASKITCETT